MSLLDQPKPLPIKGARIVSREPSKLTPEHIENQKRGQREHWKKNDRRRK